MSARTRYVVLTALRWLPVGLLAPVYVRLLLARGLDLATVGTVMIVYTLTVIALEVPTGGLADSVGTRRVLLAGTGLAIAMYAGLLFAHHVVVFFVIACVHGCDRALRSGPLEAWYVSDAVARGRGDEVTRGVSLGAVAEAGALGLGALAAGLLPLLAPHRSALTLPIVVAIGCEVVHLLLVWRLVPARIAKRHDRDDEAAAPGAIVRVGVRLATRHPELRRLLLASGAVGFALSSVELLWQPRVQSFFAASDDNAWVFGVLSSGAFFFAAIGALLAARTAGRTARPARAAARGTIGYAACFAGLAAAGGVVPFGIAYGASYLFQSATSPWQRTLLHGRTPSAARATMLSVDSLALMGGGLLGNAVLPRIAEASTIPVAWVVAAGIVAASAALYRGLDRARSDRDHVHIGAGEQRTA
jgi:MFS family permease